MSYENVLGKLFYLIIRLYVFVKIQQMSVFHFYVLYLWLGLFQRPFRHLRHPYGGVSQANR